jgi:hypothetical protein
VEEVLELVLGVIDRAQGAHGAHGGSAGTGRASSCLRSGRLCDLGNIRCDFGNIRCDFGNIRCDFGNIRCDLGLMGLMGDPPGLVMLRRASALDACVILGTFGVILGTFGVIQ